MGLSLSFLDVFANAVGMLLLLIISVLLTAKALLSKEKLELECDQFMKRREQVAQRTLYYLTPTLIAFANRWESFAQQFDAQTTEQLVLRLETKQRELTAQMEDLRRGRGATQHSKGEYLLRFLPQILGVNATNKAAMLAVVSGGEVQCYVVTQLGNERIEGYTDYWGLLRKVQSVSRKHNLFTVVIVDSGQLGAAWRFIKDLRSRGVDCALVVRTPEWDELLAKLR
jgi:hypothetical protein